MKMAQSLYVSDEENARKREREMNLLDFHLLCTGMNNETTSAHNFGGTSERMDGIVGSGLQLVNVRELRMSTSHYHYRRNELINI